MEIIKPSLEVKIKSEYVDEIVYNESLEEDQIILQQIEGEENKVYLCLNGRQISLNIEDLKDVVDMFLKRAKKT